MARHMMSNINTEKHIHQNPSFVVAASSLTGVNVVDSVAVANKDAPNEVAEGNSVKAVYCEYWTVANQSANDFGIMVIEKLPGGGTPMTFTQANNLNTYPNKKNILLTFEGLLPPNTQNPIPFVKGWIKIPKGKQRFGLGDRLRINFASSAGGLEICGFVVFKEYK